MSGLGEGVDDLRVGESVVVEPYILRPGTPTGDDDSYQLSPDMNFIGLGGRGGGPRRAHRGGAALGAPRRRRPPRPGRARRAARRGPPRLPAQRRGGRGTWRSWAARARSACCSRRC
ncbi:MAG: hypothetical protein PGN11_15735 [Quadrisphaera sp.]